MAERVGVLALQGSFHEHAFCVEKLGFRIEFVRYPEQLDRVSCLIIPGGESTAIVKLMISYGLFDRLKNMILGGFPVFGTCAGMIILSRGVVNSDQPVIGGINILVERNSYGRQIESFEEFIAIPKVNEHRFRAVFIRAPRIRSVGNNVEVLSKLKSGDVVLARQKNVLVASFHPELSGTLSVHRYFIEVVASSKKTVISR